MSQTKGEKVRVALQNQINSAKNPEHIDGLTEILDRLPLEPSSQITGLIMRTIAIQLKRANNGSEKQGAFLMNNIRKVLSLI